LRDCSRDIVGALFRSVVVILITFSDSENNFKVKWLTLDTK